MQTPNLMYPERLVADVRTAEHVESNRRLLVGRLPPGALVEVVNVLPADDEGAHFVQIAADGPRGIPAGFVLNKPRVAPALLAAACARSGRPAGGLAAGGLAAGGLAALETALEADAARRAHALKEYLQPLRAARDEARVLATAMRAGLGRRALGAFGGDERMRPLGGGATLAPARDAHWQT